MNAIRTEKVWTLLASQTFPLNLQPWPGGGIGRHAILRGGASIRVSNLVLGTEKTPTVRGQAFSTLHSHYDRPAKHPKEPPAIKPPKAMTRIAKTTQFFSTGWAASIAFRWFVTPYLSRFQT